MIEATHFVQQNARYVEDASDNAKYYVRFLFPYSTMIFFSNDTHDLAKRVFNFGKTKRGKELWNKIPAGKYLEISLENVEELPEEA